MSHAPQEIRTFFVTATTWRRRAIFRAEPMAKLLLDTLERYRAQHKFQLHEFVLIEGGPGKKFAIPNDPEGSPFKRNLGGSFLSRHSVRSTRFQPNSPFFTRLLRNSTPFASIQTIPNPVSFVPSLPCAESKGGESEFAACPHLQAPGDGRKANLFLFLRVSVPLP